jgi:hypothetical protein
VPTKTLSTLCVYSSTCIIYDHTMLILVGDHLASSVIYGGCCRTIGFCARGAERIAGAASTQDTTYVVVYIRDIKRGSGTVVSIYKYIYYIYTDHCVRCVYIWSVFAEHLRSRDETHLPVPPKKNTEIYDRMQMIWKKNKEKSFMN